MAEVETSLDPNAPATAAALAQLRRSLSVRGLDELALATALPTTDDFMLLRFLIAREFKVDAAAQMIAARAEWVSSLDGGAGLSMLLEEWRGSGSTPRARAARRFFYAALGGTTRTGSPVMVERLGMADLAGVNREGEGCLELLLLTQTVYLEQCFIAVARASARQGRLVRATVLVDADGAALSSLWHMNVIKAVGSLGPEYYPELTERWIVRTPWSTARLFWRAFAQVIPERTRTKVTLVGADRVELWTALEPHLEKRFVPLFLGGDCATGLDHSLAEPVPDGLMAELAAQGTSGAGVKDASTLEVKEREVKRRLSLSITSVACSDSRSGTEPQRTRAKIKQSLPRVLGELEGKTGNAGEGEGEGCCVSEPNVRTWTLGQEPWLCDMCLLVATTTFVANYVHNGIT